MPVFPTITINSNAVGVTTNSSSLTYEQLISSLLWMAYDVKKLYITASSFDQVSEQLTIRKLTQAGQTVIDNFPIFIDPEQFLPAVYLDVSNKELIIDNLTTLSFTLLPNASVQFDFYVEAVSFNSLLNNQSENTMAGLKLVANEKEKEPMVTDGKKLLTITALALAIAGLIYAGKTN